jgi:Rrf2 family protein
LSAFCGLSTDTGRMRISAKADYAIRAMLELALAEEAGTRLLTCDSIAEAQRIPTKFLANVILLDLRRSGLVSSVRGPEGGYALGRVAKAISLADIIRAVDGPLATVQGQRPQDVSYSGSAEVLSAVWVAVRVSLRNVLEEVRLDHLAAGQLPRRVAKLLEADGAWENR